MEDGRSVGTAHSEAGCLVRTYWLFIGPGLIFFVLGGILQRDPPIPSPLDAAFALLAASLVLARRVDVTRFGGRDAYGEPATLAQWRAYATAVAAGGPLLWLLVRAAAHGWR